MKDVLVVLMFAVSIWMLVTSVKNEREAYRILKESSDYFEQSKQLDSLIELIRKYNSSMTIKIVAMDDKNVKHEYEFQPTKEILTLN